MLAKVNFVDINLIDLNNYEKKECVQQTSFSYGDVVGSAQMISYAIIVFQQDSSKKIALSLNMLDVCDAQAQEKLITIANKILTDIDFPVLLMSSLKDIESIFGKADFINDIYENALIYQYIDHDKNTMYSFTVNSADKLVGIELIYNKQIVIDRIEHSHHARQG